jgi:hypothetical protein
VSRTKVAPNVEGSHRLATSALSCAVGAAFVRASAFFPVQPILKDLGFVRLCCSRCCGKKDRRMSWDESLRPVCDRGRESGGLQKVRRLAAGSGTVQVHALREPVEGGIEIVGTGWTAARTELS